jgi:hypothetical protein
VALISISYSVSCFDGNVIAGHSRSQNGVASLAYAPAIHLSFKKRDARIKPAHDDGDSTKI